MFLDELESYGIEKKYFEIKKIKEFGNATKEEIENIETKAIDFDKTKKVVFPNHDYKSCDALKFSNKRNEIDFIEFKQMKRKKKIEKFKFFGKIKDSYIILNHICKEDTFEFIGKNEKLENIKKNFIICIKITCNDKERLIYAQKLNIIGKEIKNYFLKEKNIVGNNFNKPKFIPMEDFDKLYKK